MEVTGDIDMSRSLQLIAKANIIITTVRKFRSRLNAPDKSRIRISIYLIKVQYWKNALNNTWNSKMIAWEMGLSDAILATTYISVGGYWSLTFGWSAPSWRGEVHLCDR
jgi:hypothetical protein